MRSIRQLVDMMDVLEDQVQRWKGLQLMVNVVHDCVLKSRIKERVSDIILHDFFFF